MMRIVASANGLRATDRAMELLRAGADPLDAVIAGVNIVEEDPKDMSVGYGGLPNEDGVVELDASRHVRPDPRQRGGRRHQEHQESLQGRQAGHGADEPLPARRARAPCKFALAHGFSKEDLLTDQAREGLAQVEGEPVRQG